VEKEEKANNKNKKPKWTVLSSTQSWAKGKLQFSAVSSKDAVQIG
jgi:hypothetical protein